MVIQDRENSINDCMVSLSYHDIGSKENVYNIRYEYVDLLHDKVMYWPRHLASGSFILGRRRKVRPDKSFSVAGGEECSFCLDIMTVELGLVRAYHGGCVGMLFELSVIQPPSQQEIQNLNAAIR